MDITIIAFFHLLVINSLFIVIDYFLFKNISGSKVSFLLIAIAGLTSLFQGVVVTNRIIDYYFNAQWFGFSRGMVKKSIFLTGALVFVIITIVIEFPFFVFATSPKRPSLSLKSCMFSNLATNIPVGLFYYYNNMYYAHDD